MAMVGKGFSTSAVAFKKPTLATIHNPAHGMT